MCEAFSHWRQMDVWQTFCPTYSLEVEHIVTLHPLQIHIVFSVRMHCKVATVWSIKGSCCRELRYWQVAKESPGPESFFSLMPYWKIGLLVDERFYPKEKNSWITFFTGTGSGEVFGSRPVMCPTPKIPSSRGVTGAHIVWGEVWILHCHQERAAGCKSYLCSVQCSST